MYPHGQTHGGVRQGREGLGTLGSGPLCEGSSEGSHCFMQKRRGMGQSLGLVIWALVRV